MAASPSSGHLCYMAPNYPLVILFLDALIVLAGFGMACSVLIPVCAVIAKRLMKWGEQSR